MAHDVDLVCVWECQGIDLAQVFKSKLEGAGIPVLLKYDAGGIVFGLTLDGWGLVRFLVPAEFEAEARALLEEEEALMSGEAGRPDAPDSPPEDPAS